MLAMLLGLCAAAVVGIAHVAQQPSPLLLLASMRAQVAEAGPGEPSSRIPPGVDAVDVDVAANNAANNADAAGTTSSPAAQTSTSVRRDPCFASGLSKRCGCESSFTYRVPRQQAQLPLTDAQLRDEAVFAYVHVNKAGGQTVKSILLDAIHDGNWSAAGIGTYPGWQAMRRPVSAHALGGMDEELDEEERKMVPIFSCGHEHQRRALPRPNKIGACPVRAIWGGLSMGLCELFPQQPCMYFTTLRDPVQRAVSEYNYFCVLGSEGRKKWLPEWRKEGLCPVDIYEYFKMELTPANFLKLRLTRGCDGQGGVNAAKANLAHPCVQFLVIEHMKTDMQSFASKLRGPLANSFQNALHQETHINKSELQPRVRAQIQNATLMRALRHLLEDDLAIYEYAISIRESKWKTPFESCPAPGA